MPGKRKTQPTDKYDMKNNKEIRLWSDDSWRYTGHNGGPNGALAIPSPSKTRVLRARGFTKEPGPRNAGDMSKRGAEKKRELKQERIMEKVRDIISNEDALTIHTPQDVVAYVAAELFSETLSFEKPLRDRVYTYERIGADAGLVDKYKDTKSGPTQALQVNITISDKALAGIETSDEIIDALWEEE